jgi:hypothetical protein
MSGEPSHGRRFVQVACAESRKRWLVVAHAANRNTVPVLVRSSCPPAAHIASRPAADWSHPARQCHGCAGTRCRRSGRRKLAIVTKRTAPPRRRVPVWPDSRRPGRTRLAGVLERAGRGSRARRPNAPGSGARAVGGAGSRRRGLSAGGAGAPQQRELHGSAGGAGWCSTMRRGVEIHGSADGAGWCSTMSILTFCGVAVRSACPIRMSEAVAPVGQAVSSRTATRQLPGTVGVACVSRFPETGGARMM